MPILQKNFYYNILNKMIIVKLFSFSLSSHQYKFPRACKTCQTLEYHHLASTIQAYCLEKRAPVGEVH